MLDLIFDQTSGLTLVAVTFLQFAGLVQDNSFSFSFSFSFSSDNFVRTNLFTIFASFASTSAEQASSSSYSAAMVPRKSLSTVPSVFLVSFDFLLSLVKSELT